MCAFTGVTTGLCAGSPRCHCARSSSLPLSYCIICCVFVSFFFSAALVRGVEKCRFGIPAAQNDTTVHFHPKNYLLINLCTNISIGLTEMCKLTRRKKTTQFSRCATGCLLSLIFLFYKFKKSVGATETIYKTGRIVLDLMAVVGLQNYAGRAP